MAIVDRGGIWIVSVDGQNRRLVTADGAAPDWSPDGKELVFAGGQFGEDVLVAGTDGSNLRTLIAHANGGTPSWSPDGTEIAFNCGLSPLAVCQIRPDGSGEQSLVTGAADIVDSYDAAWGPTSGALVFVRVDPVWGDGDAHIVLWPERRQVTTATAGKQIVVLTRTGRTVGTFLSGGPVAALTVSSRIVAALVHEQGGHWAIEIYQPRRRVVTLTAAPEPVLSSSGNILVFQMRHSIETLNALRGSPQPVATTSSRAIGLSILGTRIAWAENRRQTALIRTLSIGP